jgi:hypothetical protein
MKKQLARRPKRLTRLKINEVSAVDSGAAIGAHVVVMKGVTTGRGRWARQWDDAYTLLPRRKKGGGDAIGKGETSSLARAKREIRINKLAAAGYTAPKESDMEIDIMKAMSNRIAEVQKVFPNLSDASVMARIAESRAPEDQALWREYKGGVALSSSVEKSVKVKKTLKTMSARIDELMATNPSIRSRESAIAKVAVSPLSADQELWRDYRIASQQVPDAALRSEPAPVGKAVDEVEFERLCANLRQQYPGFSGKKYRAWATQIIEQAPAPPPTHTRFIAPPNR